MPNWCNNTLRISGDKEVISRIKDWYEKHQSDKTEVGLFGLFYPLPSELKDTTSPSPEPNEALIKKYGADNWYDWRVQNWGVKWDTDEINILGETENELCCSFGTAWCPPIWFYQKLSRDYPRLHIRVTYCESGMDLCGTWDKECGESSLNISDIKAECLEIYKSFYKDCVDEFDFRQRLESIYETDFPISDDIDVYEIFDDYYFEENLEDEEFCKEYNIQPKKDNQ